MRDYKAEYRRRIANATAKGLTRSQARGHAKAAEPPARPSPGKGTPDKKLEDALKRLRAGATLTDAAKIGRVSRERFRRFLADNGLASRSGQKWTITDNRPRQMPIYSRRRLKSVVVANFEESSLAGAYWHAAGSFVSTNNIELLTPFAGRGVKDIKGKIHPLETDPNAIHRLAAAGTPAFHEIYRIVQ